MKKGIINHFMQKGFVTAVIIGLTIASIAQPNPDPRIENLLKKMSIEEKVGQMTQIDLNLLAKGGYANTTGELDPALVEKAIVQYKVGSVLNPVGHGYEVATWHKIISQIQDAAKRTPNKIPVVYGIDAIHGTTFTLNATLFPQNPGLAATRNEALVKQTGKVTAKETRASGIRWNFAPVLDVGRQPLWSRFAETWGEDVYLTTRLGVSLINGMQEGGIGSPVAVASCMKHFIGYSAPKSGKDRTPAHIPDIILREYYLPQFKAAVQAGSPTIMINSAEINGIPTHANEYLLKEVLRKELGFKGLVVTDWEDIIRLHTRMQVAATPKEAVRMAILAGIDMSMVPNDYSFHQHLVELVKEGAVSMEVIDSAVRRILQFKSDLGLFANPYPEKEAAKNFGLPEHGTIALQAARESMTLLKNDTMPSGSTLLPLPKKSKVLLAGPGADNVTTLFGCWSYTWQGNNPKYYPATTQTIRSAMEAKIGKENVLFRGSKEYNAKQNYDVTDLIAEAKKVDYIVLCLGEDAYAESPGAIDDLNLPEEQLKLAEAAISTGVPVVLVLVEGRPRVINPIVKGSKGILLAYWPGTKGAEAISDVLFGDYNPDGRLPFTYPAHSGDIVLYDHKFTELIQETSGGFTYNGYKPQWPFGHGLSYTTFVYNDLSVSKTQFSGDEKLVVSVTVTNKGSRDGKHTVELYSRDLFASVTPDQKRLRKFKKIELKAGESTKVTFEIDRHDLAFVNQKLETVTEPGDFELMVGRLKTTVTFK